MIEKKNSSPETSGSASASPVRVTEPPCFVVGIGASAGGQGPLEHIFTAMSSDCGISFVVIMHIPPEGPSFLAEMLGRYTTMTVVTAEEGMDLAPNTVHVIPAGRDLTVSDGRLRLEEPESSSRAAHHPIDRFFQSLAAELNERAVAVVLSGFGLDGAAGAKAVKEAGGVVMVQEPGSALNPAMPQSAIATGAVDFILPADEIPAKIAEIARGTCTLTSRACETATLDDELQAIFASVEAATGHNFSSYKASTVMRRIERRMAVNEVAGIRKYAALVRENAQEAHALAQDILIGVTSFFRDPDAFETIRQTVIPRLFADRDPADPVRIWHACCATGEEVYSMAFLIREYLDEQRLDAKVQFFATDIDEAAVAQGRAGIYGDGIEAEVGEKRLRTFFTRLDGRWQVVKPVREMIVFAHHSLIKNPPFSRLDLLVCRNFLIYLTPDMQKRLMTLFHQVLKPGGFLFLGSAEAVGRQQSDLFTPVDKKWKIFGRREGESRAEPLFPFTTPVRTLPGSTRLSRRSEDREPLPGTLAERLLLERYSPPCVVVNEKYEVVHVSTRTNRFLELPVGEPTRDILKMAREELRPALRAAIYKVFAEQRQVAFREVKVTAGAEDMTVNVLVEPLATGPSSGKLAMVVFEPVSPSQAHAAPASAMEALPGDESAKDILVRQLEDQLRITHEQLQAVTEQLETSQEGFLTANEELLSMNEEFQSANEELQSTNEELETSKEELQALNEELVTVNAELQGKVEELNQLNSDMENLLASSEIATIFLDRQLKIKGYTPAMTRVFNLIPADVGRPFHHLAGKIDWPSFSHDAELVLTGEPFAEREVTTLDEELVYLKRLFPYRTAEGRIDGIVVILIDITERKRMENAVRESEARLRLFIEHAPAALAMFDTGMRYLSVSRRWLSDYGLGERDLIGECHYDVFPEISAEWREAHRRGLAGEVLRSEGDRFGRADGSAQWVRWEIRPWHDVAGNIGGIVIFAEDISDIKEAELALRRAKEEWERTFDSVPDLIAIMDENHRIVRANRAMSERLGVTPKECEGKLCYHSVHGDNGPTDNCPHVLTLADGREHQAEVREERLGGDFLVTTTPLLDEQGAMMGTVHVARDITERKRIEAEIRQHAEELEAANAELTRFNTASVGRELRMIELKREINELCAKVDEAPRYPLDFEEG